MSDIDHLALTEAIHAQLLLIRRQKDATLLRLHDLEVQEEQVIENLRKACGGTLLNLPIAKWEDLSDLEKLTLHFIAKRVRIKRVQDLLPTYMAETGDEVTESAFRMRLTRLREKGVLMRGFNGWTVHPSILETARNPPVLPPPPRKGRLGALDKLVKRVEGAEPLPRSRSPVFQHRRKRDKAAGQAVAPSKAGS